MKIAGFFNGHDCSFCILEDGVPILHAEYERYLRLKEPEGDSYGMLLDIVKLFTFTDLPMVFQRYIIYSAASLAATQLVVNPQ